MSANHSFAFNAPVNPKCRVRYIALGPFLYNFTILETKDSEILSAVHVLILMCGASP